MPLIFSPQSLIVVERSSATYSVALAQKPTHDVTVAITGHDAHDHLSVGQLRLTFTPDTWSAPQSITLQLSKEAPDNELDEEITLTHTCTSQDAFFSGKRRYIRIGLLDQSETYPAVPAPKTLAVTIARQDKLTTAIQSGQSVTVTTALTGTATGASRYRWEYREQGETDWEAQADGTASTQTFKFSPSKVTTYELRCVVRREQVVATSNILTISWMATPTVSVSISGASMATVGTAIPITATVTGTATGDIVHEWQVNSGSWTTLSGETGATISPVSNSATSLRYRCRATRQGVTSDWSNVLTLTWTAVPPTPTLTATASASSNSVTAGIRVTLSVALGGTATGAATYQWQVSPVGTTRQWTNLPGGTVAQPTVRLTVPGAQVYRVTVVRQNITAISNVVSVTWTAVPPRVSLSLSPNPVEEGLRTIITLTLDRVSTRNHTVALSYVFRGSAQSSDILESPKNIIIPAGALKATGVLQTAWPETDFTVAKEVRVSISDFDDLTGGVPTTVVAKIANFDIPLSVRMNQIPDIEPALNAGTLVQLERGVYNWLDPDDYGAVTGNISVEPASEFVDAPTVLTIAAGQRLSPRVDFGFIGKNRSSNVTVTATVTNDPTGYAGQARTRTIYGRGVRHVSLVGPGSIRIPLRLPAASFDITARISFAAPYDVTVPLNWVINRGGWTEITSVLPSSITIPAGSTSQSAEFTAWGSAGGVTQGNYVCTIGTITPATPLDIRPATGDSAEVRGLIRT